MFKRKCKVCSKIFYIQVNTVNRGFYCSRKCYKISKKGKPTWNKGLTKEIDKRLDYIRPGSFKKGYIPWKKGRINKFAKFNGRVMIYTPNHPFHYYNGRILRARLVMERHLGRYLTKEEVVHHINEIRDDDRLSNLMLFVNGGEHTRFHHKLNRQKQHNNQ